MKNQYRQGDVFLRPVSSIPADAKPIKRVGGRVILAEGEVTGHHHAIQDAGVALLEHEARRYLRVPETAALRHEEHTKVDVAPGLYEVVIQREYTGEDEFERVRD